MPDDLKVVISNRKARRDFSIEDVFEAGLVLRGAEVKTLRESKGNINDGYASVESGEIWLHGMHLPPYTQSSTHETLDPDRKRKLLLRSEEIARIEIAISQKGYTLVPLRVYFKQGFAKVEVGLGKGKKHHDRRQEIAKRDVQREVERELRRRR